MKVYGYARVSTEEQVKSGSLNQQIDKIKNYCDRTDHKLLQLFTDAGVSAIKERPQFEKMMETISEDGVSGENVKGIVVTKLDRFDRSVKDLVLNMETLQDQEIDFIVNYCCQVSTFCEKLLPKFSTPPTSFNCCSN